MEARQFEARTLRRSSQPLTKSDLEEGGIYFVCGFLDKEMVIPELRPVVFVGRNLKGESDKIRCYFQDFASYQRGTRFGTSTKDAPAQFEVCGEDDLGFVYGFEEALNELLKCSLRRRTKR
jgi:hypothetical protein